MGCVRSKHFGRTRTRLQNFSLLASQTFFSEAEVEVLHELFTKLTSCVSSDNLITRVKEMLIDVLEESELMLTESIIDSIVSKTFEEADRKKDGKIDLEEWENFVARHPLTLKNMTIPLLK
ncbi:Calcineurin B-like protein 5 [Raphanus sativus]|nr:Calcineurin B-like protein 5 [Raphanus sativus]